MQQNTTHMRAHTHTHKYTPEYYSVSKKNEIRPFAATQMDPESVILSQANHTHTHTQRGILLSQ